MALLLTHPFSCCWISISIHFFSFTESPEKAYDVLEVPKEIDDGMLITVYQMRVEEQPMQLEKMQQALFMIAEIRDSVRLREFARTSKDRELFCFCFFDLEYGFP